MLRVARRCWRLSLKLMVVPSTLVGLVYEFDMDYNVCRHIPSCGCEDRGSTNLWLLFALFHATNGRKHQVRALALQLAVVFAIRCDTAYVWLLPPGTILFRVDLHRPRTPYLLIGSSLHLEIVCYTSDKVQFG